MQYYSLAGKNHRVVKVLLSVLLCFSMVPSVAFAVEGEASDVEPLVTTADEGEDGVLSSPESVETNVAVDSKNELEGDSGIAPSENLKTAVDAPEAEEEGGAAGFVEIDAGKQDDDADSTTESSSVASGNMGVEKPTLGFVYVDEAQLNEGDTQNIVAALSDEEIVLKSATLHLTTWEGEKTIDASVIEDNGARFEMRNMAAGEYELAALDFSLADADDTFREELQGKGYFFEVLAPESSAIEVSALSLDESGSLEGVEEAEEVIEETLESAPAMMRNAAVPMAAASAVSARAASVPGLVVALDPGHGGSDSGACSNGLKEKDINLKIAKYCQAALQRAGVSVAMTRSSDVYVGLSERVEIAAKAGATVFVSLHINSATPAAKGCEVWVPNDSSYNYDTHVAGKALGQKVIAKLAALGLSNRGVKTRDSENGSKYADGSVADYYSVINGARKRGIPGIIIEHAFITNPGDAVYMSSEANLKKLGEADAQGIIESINQGIIKGKGGLVKTSEGYQYKNADGSIVKNAWMNVGSDRYRFGTDGYALVYAQNIGGKYYYFDGAGRMQKGWVTWKADGSKSYFGPDGAALSGWQSISGKWYYFNPSSWRSARWANVIDGKYYYFDGSSRMQTGWVTWKADGSKSYFGADGAALSGWQSISGQRYYFNPSNWRSARWASVIDGRYYYFNSNCTMHTGWLTWKADGSKSYFGSDGAALLGWQSISGKWYYFNPTNWRSARWANVIDGKYYYFDGSSRMQTGWVTWKADGSKSYFGADGAALSGWQSISGQRYYFNPSNWRSARWMTVVDGKSYYFNSNCTMHTGWLTWKADGSKSYFGSDGAMLTGQATVDGTLYDFGSDGKVRNRIMGAPRATVAAMVKDYNTQVARIGKSYPSAVYAAKGAPTIESFCRTLYNEAVYEGVAPEVLYAQAMLETGLLQFGGDVKAEQCNFGGLGATGNGNPGNVFPDVAIGLRAQVQHLKAYGSKEPLKGECVDVRFGYVNRGCAPYVADLAGKWASDKKYGIKLNQIIDRVCG